VPAARAGVGGGDEQERGGEPERTVDAIDGDAALFERLAQALDGGARELGEFVEEQDAVVGERDPARRRFEIMVEPSTSARARRN
jgi:hypothetical protein